MKYKTCSAQWVGVLGVAVGQGWIPIYRELKKSGMNVGFALLKEKVTSWTQDLVIPPQAMERGMADSVYAFMNWVIGPEMGARMGRSVGYVSPSGAALSLLSPAEAQEIGYDDIEKVWQNSLPVTDFGSWAIACRKAFSASARSPLVAFNAPRLVYVAGTLGSRFHCWTICRCGKSTR